MIPALTNIINSHSQLILHAVTVVESTVLICGVRWAIPVTAPPGATWTCRDNHGPYTVSTICEINGALSEPTAAVERDESGPVATITQNLHPTHSISFTPPAYDAVSLAD